MRFAIADKDDVSTLYVASGDEPLSVRGAAVLATLTADGLVDPADVLQDRIGDV
jgi:hypothetical protein